VTRLEGEAAPVELLSAVVAAGGEVDNEDGGAEAAAADCKVDEKDDVASDGAGEGAMTGDEGDVSEVVGMLLAVDEKEDVVSDSGGEGTMTADDDDTSEVVTDMSLASRTVYLQARDAVSAIVHNWEILAYINPSTTTNPLPAPI
jgi:hypothetical protein